MAQRRDDRHTMDSTSSFEGRPPEAKSVALRRLQARRRLEDYWEEKRLREHLDDFDDL